MQLFNRKLAITFFLNRGDIVLVVVTTIIIIFYLLPSLSTSAPSQRQAVPFKNSGHKWEPDYIYPKAARKQLLYETKILLGFFQNPHNIPEH